jgi:hypothetical protein
MMSVVLATKASSPTTGEGEAALLLLSETDEWWEKQKQTTGETRTDQRHERYSRHERHERHQRHEPSAISHQPSNFTDQTLGNKGNGGGNYSRR